ncbi:MAG: type II toxin-antitoxin system VapC family toxin [Gammaproteobacteria bacterium]|nr:type II toxin-antitoxin system VapC family toxin [Gammaproteobacteria bacterium]
MQITNISDAKASLSKLVEKNPFDRILVAQAQVERLTLVIHNPRMKGYSVQVIET